MIPSAMDEMSKQGLYFWLKSVVESRRCHGVTWIDEATGVFQIPWSNQKSRTWQKEDSSVFLEYAKHTCKYKPGDKMDFPKWKQNLKSAINKNRYIERLRNHDRLSGPKPYRVYKLLNEKTERKRSSDGFPDVAMNVTADYLNPAHLSNIESAGGLGEHNEVLLAQRDTSASGIVVYSDSGSRSSRTSPLSSTSGLGTFRWSPDIPRSDSCDLLQGNIPTFVISYCDTTLHPLSGEESLMSEATQTIQSTADLPTLEINQPSDGSENNTLGSHLETQGNDNQMLHSGQGLRDKATLGHVPPEILSNSVVATSNGTMLLKSVCAKRRQDNNPAAGVANVQQPHNPVSFQRHVSSSSTDHFPSASRPVSPHAGLAWPVVSLQNNASQDYPQELSLKMQPARQEADNSRDAPMVYEMPPTSLPELGGFGGCSSDRPVSMDTYDVNRPSDSHKFSGSQFTAYRDAQIPEAASKGISISPATKSMPDDSLMHVQVLYGTPHRTVKKTTITSNRSSCRLFYGSVNCSIMQKAIQGQQDAEEVELPSVDTSDCEYYDEDKKTAIRKILKDMELGIVISYSNNDIYVERRCLPRVYLSDGVSKSESLPRSTKKRPDVKTLAFDYNKHFKESIELNKRDNGAVPKDHFILTIGYQILANDDSPTRMVPIYIVVRHVKAAKERFNILGASTIAPNPMCSDPNSFDKDIRLFKELDLKPEV